MTVFYRVTRSEDEQLVLEQVEQDAAKIPTEITDFIPLIDGVDRRVRRLIPERARRETYMKAIDGAARSAFEGGNLTTAKLGLDSVKANIVEWEGPEIRKRYLGATVRLFGLSGIVALLVLIAVKNASMSYLSMIPPHALRIIETGSCLMIGVSLGIVLLAFVRNLELRFETLGAFDAAQLNPSMRLTFVTVLAAVFAIVLQQRILVIAIVNYELNSLFDSPMVAVVVGILCGFADMIVANLISSMFEKTAAKA